MAAPRQAGPAIYEAANMVRPTLRPRRLQTRACLASKTSFYAIPHGGTHNTTCPFVAGTTRRGGPLKRRLRQCGKQEAPPCEGRDTKNPPTCPFAFTETHQLTYAATGEGVGNIVVHARPTPDLIIQAANAAIPSATTFRRPCRLRTSSKCRLPMKTSHTLKGSRRKFRHQIVFFVALTPCAKQAAEFAKTLRPQKLIDTPLAVRAARHSVQHAF